MGSSGVDVDLGGTMGEVPEGSDIGCAGSLDLELSELPPAQAPKVTLVGLTVMESTGTGFDAGAGWVRALETRPP